MAASPRATWPLAGLLTLLATLPSPAAATSPEAPGGLDAHGFDAFGLDDLADSPWTNPRLGELHAGNVYLGAVAEYANGAVRRYTWEDGAAELVEVPVASLVVLNLGGGVDVADWLRVRVGLPVALTHAAEGRSFEPPALGDLRLGLVLPVTERASGFAVALHPELVVPTGATREWFGQAGWSGGGVVSGHLVRRHLIAGGHLGVLFQPEMTTQDLTGADRLRAGLDLTWLPDPALGVTVEAHGQYPLAHLENPLPEAPAELLLGLRHRYDGGAWTGVGGAVGLTPAVGAASWRLFVAGGWGRTGEAGARDDDGDGVVNSADRCPSRPETPEGVLDEDGCPELPAMVRVELDRTGLSGAALEPRFEAEREGQRLVPGAAEPTWTFPTVEGARWVIRASVGPCLAGETTLVPRPGENLARVRLAPVREATLRVDVVDEFGQPLPGAVLSVEGGAPGCAPEAGLPPGVPTAVGPGEYVVRATAPSYPPVEATVVALRGGEVRARLALQLQRVVLGDTAIGLFSPVYFGDDDHVLELSRPLLDDVAELLLQHPEIRRVEIGVHSDAEGPDAANLARTARRAEAVRGYLVERGVAPERLVARGYGETQPVDTNATAEGRAHNRRVELHILERGR